MTREQRVAALKAAAAQRILILDGAMGTMIQRHKFDEATFRGKRFVDHPRPVQGNNDLLVLTCPEAIEHIHASYLGAGSDIISSNTFNAQRHLVSAPTYRVLRADALATWRTVAAVA